MMIHHDSGGTNRSAFRKEFFNRPTFRVTPVHAAMTALNLKKASAKLLNAALPAAVRDK